MLLASRDSGWSRLYCELFGLSASPTASPKTFEDIVRLEHMRGHCEGM